MTHHNAPLTHSVAALVAAAAFPASAQCRPPRTLHVGPGGSLGAALAESTSGDTIEITGKHYWRDLPGARDGLTLKGGTLVVVGGPIRSRSVAHVEGVHFEMADDSTWYDGHKTPWPAGSSLSGNTVEVQSGD